MNSTTRLVAVVAGLVLMMHSTPSWSGTINPTASDENGNTAGGTGALPVVTGGSNTAFGHNALLNNTAGFSNTATGENALQNNNGGNNTATGVGALSSNSSGNLNTATGVNALLGNTTGIQNTATGVGALQSNTTGTNNTATGTQALQNTAGSNNTATGASALLFTTGNANTATGFQALNDNTAGSNNTAVGAKALKKSLGAKNIGIGYQAGVTLTTGNNNIYIGNQGAGSEFQTIRIGTAQSSTFIAGINGAIVSGTTVEIDTITGQLGVVPSSARYKQDIAAMGTRSEGVLQLRPVTFAYRDDTRGTTHYGLVAEEVAAVYPDLVTRTATGEIQTVKYLELIPMLLNELQRQRHEFKQALESQQDVLQRQQQELADLRALVGQGRETASLAR